MLTQSVCRACMEVEKTASFEEFEQVGPPCPWDLCGAAKGPEHRWDTPEGCMRIFNYDTALWDKGMVSCPHRRKEVAFGAALPDCLRRGAHLAAEGGAMLVEDL